jgi:hypothetical protein
MAKSDSFGGGSDFGLDKPRTNKAERWLAPGLLLELRAQKIGMFAP